MAACTQRETKILSTACPDEMVLSRAGKGHGDASLSQSLIFWMLGRIHLAKHPNIKPRGGNPHFGSQIYPVVPARLLPDTLRALSLGATIGLPDRPAFTSLQGCFRLSSEASGSSPRLGAEVSGGGPS